MQKRPLHQRHSDALCGFFSDLTLQQIDSGVYKGLWIAATDLGDIARVHHAPMSPRGINDLGGFGTAFDRQVAEQRAYGEAVERYCSVMFPTDNIIRASHTELGSDALPINQFPRCSRAERRSWSRTIGLKFVDQTTKLDWVEAYSVTREHRLWIPVDMAFMGMRKPLTDMLTPPVSTGFAAGLNYEMAVQNALLEVIERDAVALWWWGKICVPHMSYKFFDDEQISHFEHLAFEQNVKVIYLDLTTDIGVPVIGVLQLQSCFPYVTFMSASRMTQAPAALRALEEVGSVRKALETTRAPANEASLLSGDPHDPVEFALYYAGGHHLNAFDFATETPDLHPNIGENLSPPAAGLSITIARLADLGHEVIVINCSTSEARALGYTVVRVIVPGLLGISFTHSIRFLGETRFRRYCKIPTNIDPMEFANANPIPFA